MLRGDPSVISTRELQSRPSRRGDDGDPWRRESRSNLDGSDKVRVRVSIPVVLRCEMTRAAGELASDHSGALHGDAVVLAVIVQPHMDAINRIVLQSSCVQFPRLVHPGASPGVIFDYATADHRELLHILMVLTAPLLSSRMFRRDDPLNEARDVDGENLPTPVEPTCIACSTRWEPSSVVRSTSTFSIT
ncbi:hypothetical protein POX_f07977 [Penicillium oxalicum]|uniref:hypothetical protein n=1 Tax=Penicillium oxalicum TaxID=69781 RepID=UPI0020B7496F|nr:hypothetical protein POX_f07977 [Penicillium oxalicum]KAI2787604.1 hypothetical protein POX_f07977 [Penicillium oxalicum]